MSETPMLKTNETGYALLRDPRRNTGTAFTEQEREAYGLEGLQPMDAVFQHASRDKHLK